MVNAGAIVTASLVTGASIEERFEAIRETLSAFAGRALELDHATLASVASSNQRNRLLAQLLHEAGGLELDPVDAALLYAMQCSVHVTARDLATMGATLANGGVNPLTGDAVVSPRTSRHVLAVMATAGMYEHSGDWLYDVGLPGKSGIGGGIVTVAPGKGGLATFSPRLDPIGNSVRGKRATELLACTLGLDLFAAAPD